MQRPCDSQRVPLSASRPSMRAVVRGAQLAARSTRRAADSRRSAAALPAVMDAQVTAEDARRAVDLFHLCEQLKARDARGALRAPACSRLLAPPALRASRRGRQPCCAAAAARVGGESEAASLPPALTRLGGKRTKRTGWLRFGIEGTESIADHMYRMVRSAEPELCCVRSPRLQSVMAFVCGSTPGYDMGKCVKLAIMHDIAEAIVGDITPLDGVPKAEKHAREAAAVSHMQQLMGGAAWARAGEELVALWNEYEGGATMEAKLLKVRVARGGALHSLTLPSGPGQGGDDPAGAGVRGAARRVGRAAETPGILYYDRGKISDAAGTGAGGGGAGAAGGGRTGLGTVRGEEAAVQYALMCGLPFLPRCSARRARGSLDARFRGGSWTGPPGRCPKTACLADQPAQARDLREPTHEARRCLDGGCVGCAWWRGPNPAPRGPPPQRSGAPVSCRETLQVPS